MADLLNKARAVAATDTNVMLCGETGTGRDSLAEAIQFMSLKTDEPFYVLRCGEDNDEDAINNLSTGTIYLDEVHRLTMGLQRKLLIRLRDNGQGMRIISSACVTIESMVSHGKFYSALHSILSGIRLDIPPLRERREDIYYIVLSFIKKYNRKYQKRVTIESGAMKLLRHYTFPGNLAELDSIIHRAVLINTSGTIKTNSIMTVLDMDKVVFATLIKGTNIEYQREMDRLSKELIINALRNTGSMRQAAKQLNLTHGTMSNKCNTLGIDIDKYTMD